MFNAAILNGTTVTNIIVLNDLSEHAGARICPEWVCIGDDIGKPEPEPPPPPPSESAPPSPGAQKLA